MKKQMILGIFIMAMAGASVLPLKYLFSEKQTAPLPPHTTYEEAVVVALPKKIVELAETKKCSDYIIPVREVTGDAGFLINLKDDLNLGLQAFSGWRLRVDDQLKEKMRKRADERFKIWGTMGVGEEMVALSKTQKSVAMKTKYSAAAKCTTLDATGANDTKLVLSISDEQYQTTLFEISLDFIHPQTLGNLKLKKEIEEKKIAGLKKKAFISLYILILISICFVFYLLFLTLAKIRDKKRIHQFKQFIANEIEKREELINEGHFVTALDLSDKYLAEFPHDSEIKAFRARLLDYTNNDPEKAQLAYVEWKKLQKRMKTPLLSTQEGLLNASEKKKITNLVPYHPELKASYHQLMQEEEKQKRAANETAVKSYNAAIADLKKGNLKGAVSILDEILNMTPGFYQATELKEMITTYRPGNFTFLSEEKPVAEVFVTPAIRLGREDTGVLPDIVINDKRVSRDHLVIRQDEAGFLVSDSGSSGGTFINGDAVTTAPLKNGDLLTIAKVIDFQVTITDGQKAMWLKGKDADYLFVKESIAFDVEKGRVTIPGKGFTINKSDGFLLLTTDKETVAPAKNMTITSNEDQFKIEVKQ